MRTPSSPATPHVLFAGGGSLGNIYPGLSIAEHLARSIPRMRLTIVGDGRPVERHTVNGAGRRYLSIPARPLPRNVGDGLRFLTDNTAGYCAARWILKEHRVSLVVGLGGHASGPMLRAADASGVPFVMLEPNVLPSFTTKRLADRAQALFLAHEETRPHLPVIAPTRVTGVPGRPTLSRPKGPRISPAGDEPAKRLVILGGEGGASSLNESMPVVLQRLALANRGWSIVHQTGEGQLLDTIHRYQRMDVNAVVVTYIDEMADLLRETDLVVCRASGCTLAELAMAEAPALLAPDARLDRGSQLANARLAEVAGRCAVVDESRGDLVGPLTRELGRLVDDETIRGVMRQSSLAAAKPEAAGQIAAACLETLGMAPAQQTRRLAA